MIEKFKILQTKKCEQVLKHSGPLTEDSTNKFRPQCINKQTAVINICVFFFVTCIHFTLYSNPIIRNLRKNSNEYFFTIL